MDVDSRTTEILNYASMLKKLFAYCIGLTFGCPCNMTTAKLSTKNLLQGIKQTQCLQRPKLTMELHIKRSTLYAELK